MVLHKQHCIIVQTMCTADSVHLRPFPVQITPPSAMYAKALHQWKLGIYGFYSEAFIQCYI